MAHRFLHPPTLACSIVIATRNRCDTLLSCLQQTVAACARLGDAEIILVDNASTDDTLAQVRAQFPSVTVIPLTINGGPVAKNAAIAQSRGRFVVLMDDDAYPLGDALQKMMDHFAAQPDLGAAVFDVRLTDGRQEASAFDAVFIGAGTGLRRTALERVGFLPPHFFMQAEEYDLSFRLINAGFRIARFSDMPLRHLKSPQARLASRTTMLDPRNNLFLLARYLPEKLAMEYAAHWLARYWLMARTRDAAGGTAHRRAFLAGADAGLRAWSDGRQRGTVLSPDALESIFHRTRIGQQVRTFWDQTSPRTPAVVLIDLGKNMPAVLAACKDCNLPIAAIADDQLGHLNETLNGIPILPVSTALAQHPSAPCILTHASSIHAQARGLDQRLLNRSLLILAAPDASTRPIS